MSRKAPRPKQRDVITLADLTPRQRVVGGSQRRVFGSGAPVAPAAGTSTKAAKDLPVAKDVKAGKKAR